LEVPGDWNSSPSPIQRITEGRFSQLISSKIPRWIEPRQLLDQPFEEQQFRTTLIYWFDDCGIMMLFPEAALYPESLRIGESPEGDLGIVGAIEYYRVGCVHEYDEQVAGDVSGDKYMRVKVCQRCDYVKAIPR